MEKIILILISFGLGLLVTLAVFGIVFLLLFIIDLFSLPFLAIPIIFIAILTTYSSYQIITMTPDYKRLKELKKGDD